MYLRRWMELQELKQKKWFFRVMDDSYIHLENLYDYVSKLDHTVPYVVARLLLCVFRGPQILRFALLQYGNWRQVVPLSRLDVSIGRAWNIVF